MVKKIKNPFKTASDAKLQLQLAQGVSMALMAGLRGEEADMDLGQGVRIHCYQVMDGGPFLRIDLLGLNNPSRLGGGDNGG